tara:strand:- start:84 stop:476 length:393 start_codon:yes stop_codon:yes gene_type:complete
MAEKDIEYIMARIYAMDEVRKNLARAIKEDKEYLLEIMGEKECLTTPSYTAKMKSRTQTRVMGIEHIRNILGRDAVDKITKTSTSRSLTITESAHDFELFEVEDLELVPHWAKNPYIELQVRESIGEREE